MAISKLIKQIKPHLTCRDMKTYRKTLVELASTFMHRMYARYVLRFSSSYETYARAQLRVLPLIRENIILSYPRSSSHWVRFIVEFLTGFPTNQEWCYHYSRFICNNIFPTKEHPLGHVRKELPPLYRRLHGTRLWNPNGTLWPIARCIFIIRNPLDCIVRQLQIEPEFRDASSKKHYETQQEFERSWCKLHARWWLDLLRAYDTFAGPKCIIWYPDLIHDPEKAIRQISAFCGYDGPRLEMLIKNHQYYADINRKLEPHEGGAHPGWRGSTKEMGNRYWGGSISGDNLDYYANKAEFKQRRSWIEEELRLRVEGPDKKLSAYLNYFGLNDPALPPS